MLETVSPLLIGMSVALGIGLLIGAERERRKGETSNRSAAGIRTFAVCSLMGAVSVTVGGNAMLGVGVVIVGAGSLMSYLRTREQDPGLTTEFALVLTCLLGGLAMTNALWAAGIGAVLAALLAARNRLHHFVRSVLTEQELHDILLFAAMALIVLPQAPDRFMGPWDAMNPHAIAQMIVMVMAISAAGYVAVRSLGPRYGLPLAGFASGFVSSTATIYSMGTRATQQAMLARGAVAGAVLSSVATVIQMTAVVGLIAPVLLAKMSFSLALGGLAAALYGLYFLRGVAPVPVQTDTSPAGRALDLKTALGFAALVAIVLVASAGLNAWLGARGMLLGAAVTGLADAHSTAAAAASLLASAKVSANQAALTILVGFSANTLMKCLVAFKAGGTPYALKIVPGLALMVGAAWVGYWLQQV